MMMMKGAPTTSKVSTALPASQCNSALLRTPRLAYRRSLQPCRADSNSNSTGGSEQQEEKKGIQIDISKIPPLTWDEDKETLRDMMAFSGPAPERINGRLAMWAFASIAIGEVTTKTPALEQMANGWLGAVFFSIMISFASVLPKAVSGYSLRDLLDAATTDKMQGEGIQKFISLFDQNLELWGGRLAMIGIVGLPIAEYFAGDALF